MTPERSVATWLVMFKRTAGAGGGAGMVPGGGFTGGCGVGASGRCGGAGGPTLVHVATLLFTLRPAEFVATTWNLCVPTGKSVVENECLVISPSRTRVVLFP